MRGPVLRRRSRDFRRSRRHGPPVGRRVRKGGTSAPRQRPAGLVRRLHAQRAPCSLVRRRRLLATLQRRVPDRVAVVRQPEGMGPQRGGPARRPPRPDRLAHERHGPLGPRQRATRPPASPAPGGRSIWPSAPDARQVASASNNGLARIWSLPAPTLPLLPFSAEEAWHHQRAAARRLALPPQTTNSLGMRLALVPPGLFHLGNTCQVHIRNAYYLGTTEVTVAQFRRFVDETGYRTEAEKSGRGGLVMAAGKQYQHPDFTWRNPPLRRRRRSPGRAAGLERRRSLLQVAERQGGKDVPSADGSRMGVGVSSGHHRTAILRGPSGPRCACLGPGQLRRPRGTRSARLKQNPFGLFDVYGNGTEYCLDWHHAYPPAFRTDFSGPPTGEHRVIRGLGFCDSDDDVQSGMRGEAP